jgi:UDP-3-O-acyl-N-acetylglucosamine deacetylase
MWAHHMLEALVTVLVIGIGHLVAHRGGHALHTAFAAKILEERDAWELVEEPFMPAQPVPAGALGATVAAGR